MVEIATSSARLTRCETEVVKEHLMRCSSSVNSIFEQVGLGDERFVAEGRS